MIKRVDVTRRGDGDPIIVILKRTIILVWVAMNEPDYADVGRPYSIETVKKRWSQGNTFTATLATSVEKVMGDIFSRSGA